MATTPAWWASRWRTVAGARNSGQYRWTGASRSTRPASTSLRVQAAASGLHTE